MLVGIMWLCLMVCNIVELVEHIWVKPEEVVVGLVVVVVLHKQRIRAIIITSLLACV